MTSRSSRIQLINNFKPLVFSKKRPIDKRISKSTIFLSLNSISLVILLGYCYTSIVIETIGIQSFINWNTMGLMVILFIINTINFQNNVFQYLLLKHLRFLKQNSDHFIEWEINENLQKIINQLNKPSTSRIAIVTSSIVLIIVEFNFSSHSNFEFGSYSKFVFVFYTIYFFRSFWNKYKQLIQNLIHVEIN